MALITLRQLLDHAAENDYGVPAFNINNMEQGLAIMKAELGKRGTFYRLRLVGFKDRKAARRACKALKRGRVSCLVVPANS
jgi:hypothetical protein